MSQHFRIKLHKQASPDEPQETNHWQVLMLQQSRSRRRNAERSQVCPAQLHCTVTQAGQHIAS